jgi:hypothetical protein
MKASLIVLLFASIAFTSFSQGNRDKYISIKKVSSKVSKEEINKKYTNPIDYDNDNILDVPIRIGDLEMDSVINLGVLDTSEIQFFIPIRNNSSKSQLVIYSVGASCGCITPTWGRTPILPNDIGYINIHYRLISKKERTISLSTNA